MTGSYQYHLDQVARLISRMYADLEKYASEPDASEKFIEIRNEQINIIVAFVNASEAAISQAFEQCIPLDQYEREKDALFRIQNKILERGGLYSDSEKIRFLRSLISTKLPSLWPSNYF